jgi:hypothetical protein
MKKLLVVLVFPFVMLSCMTTRQGSSSRAELRKEKKVTDQLIVKSAVDSRKYIIKLNRAYFSRGGMIELVPRANYIIIDGDRAIINTAYLGRQWDIRGIAGIDVRGRAQEYQVTSKLSKGSYEIKMRVANGSSAAFDVYLTISKGGYCYASVSSLKIENVRYSGYLVPIPEDPNSLLEEGKTI